MSDIVLFVGLPGSGKTYWATKLCDVVVDDITELNQLPNRDDVINRTLGITDVNFCDDNIMKMAMKILQEKYSEFKIRTIYFENNPDKCRKNVLYRNDGRNVEGTIRRFSEIYNPKEITKLIWTPQE